LFFVALFEKSVWVRDHRFLLDRQYTLPSLFSPPPFLSSPSRAFLYFPISFVVDVSSAFVYFPPPGLVWQPYVATVSFEVSEILVSLNKYPDRTDNTLPTRTFPYPVQRVLGSFFTSSAISPPLLFFHPRRNLPPLRLPSCFFGYVGRQPANGLTSSGLYSPTLSDY